MNSGRANENIFFAFIFLLACYAQNNNKIAKDMQRVRECRHRFSMLCKWSHISNCGLCVFFSPFFSSFFLKILAAICDLHLQYHKMWLERVVSWITWLDIEMILGCLIGKAKSFLNDVTHEVAYIPHILFLLQCVASVCCWHAQQAAF